MVSGYDLHLSNSVPTQLKILVTGGLGFIGSALCRELEARNAQIYILDDQSRGSLENVNGLNFQYFNADIRDQDVVRDTIEHIRPDIIIHLAAMHFIPDCNKDPETCMHINVVGTESVLNASKTNYEGKLKRVILVSSMAVYPIKDGPNKESDTIEPYDVYGESKFTNEMQGKRFHRESMVDTISVRLSNVFGPRETSRHVIPEIMEQLALGKTKIKLGNIQPERDFIYVSDVATGFADLALNPLPHGFHVINMGSGQEHSIQYVLKCISKIMNKEISYVRDQSRFREVERMHLLADISRIKSLTGWHPKVDLADGLEKLCHWYGLL